MTAQTAVATDALAVDDLNLAYVVRGVPRLVLRGVTFSVRAGEAYGLVGESGCGKSTTAYAAVRYMPPNAQILSGSVLVGGQDVTKMGRSELREFRANHVSMVYQDPGAALDPTMKIGRQVEEAYTVLGRSKSEAESEAREALRRVRIADPDRVLDRYPYQLSGGMQQRVVIAMALACNPELLVLDEPTTGLDATVEAEVLDLVQSLRAETDAAILLIAHNLGVVRSMCDRVGVMYAGRIVEEGPAQEVFDHPSHPYTIGLLNCLPRHGVRKNERALFTIPGNLPQIGTDLPTCVFVDRCQLADETCRSQIPPIVELDAGRWTRCHHVARLGEMTAAPPVVQTLAAAGRSMLLLNQVAKTFKQGGHTVPALIGVDLGLSEGETLGLVGESGSGKSTLAKTILGIHSADSGGHIQLDGTDVPLAASARPREARRAMQMVFQNPESALNRSWTVRQILKRSVTKLTGVSGAAADARVEQLAEAMRLSPRHLDLKPRHLSGGLKQRVAIARSFAGDPRMVICDEPTSALDVSVQAAILNLLAELQSAERTSYVFISHDLGVVRYLADRIAVMYLGRIVEIGATDQIFEGPNHPYTEALLSAVPSVDGEATARIRLEGEIPSPSNPPSGCPFHTRCHRVMMGTCDTATPPTIDLGSGHQIVCHLPAAELGSPVRAGAATEK